jgi:hypothetical protein
MKYQKPINSVHNSDEFSSGLMEAYGKWMGGDCFQTPNAIKEAPFDGMDPQSHGAEIEHTTTKKKTAKKETPKQQLATKEEHEVLEREEYEIDGKIYVIEKIKGADGKACWKGYKYAGTEGGKDKCVKTEEVEKKESEKDEGGKHKEYKHAPGKEEKGEKKTEKEMKKEEFESIEEKAPPGAKYERMVKHIKKGYSEDGEVTKKEKGIAYATAWKAKNKATKEEYDVEEAEALWSEVAEKLEKLGEMDGAKFKVIGEKMDPVGKEDGDIDNDGDKDKSDKYLSARRKKINKIMSMKK